MIKKILCVIVLIFGVMAYGLLGYSIISGEIAPSVEHFNRAEKLTESSKLIQVGFSSGSYSCVNNECDYSNVYNEKQYVDMPLMQNIITIKVDYEGRWHQNVETFTLKLKVYLFIFYLTLGVGSYYSIKGLTRANT